MKFNAFKPLVCSLTVVAALHLTACGDAETTITEKPPIIQDDDHNHGGGVPGATGDGRLLMVNPATAEADVYDLTTKTRLSRIKLDATPSAVYATGSYRFAALISREKDTIGFLDGGLWQEAHDDHFDVFSEVPSLSNLSFSGSRPTHFETYGGETAIFLDGDAATSSNAGVLIFDDHMIEENEAPARIEFPLPQHGVAKVRGTSVISSLRREDMLSTSTNKILPDQVGVYALKEGAYTLAQTFDVTCPDLHGAAQNEHHIVFGCADGVLIIDTEEDGSYTAKKLANTTEVAAGLRIGSLWGHPDTDYFMGLASSRSSAVRQFFVIDPAKNTLTLIDWKPVEGAKPIAQHFTKEAEQFAIVDDQGYLTLIEPHDEGDETHWEFAGARLKFLEGDLTTMPPGMNFSMVSSPSAHQLYIGDPISKHVVIIDLDAVMITDHIELDYAPANLTWLGFDAAHADEHDHD
jgi:hypothetical protein